MYSIKFRIASNSNYSIDLFFWETQDTQDYAGATKSLTSSSRWQTDNSKQLASKQKAIDKT